MSNTVWERLGKLICPNEESSSMVKYASMPMAYQLNRNEYRIYFSSRNKNNNSSIHYFEIDIRKPFELKHIKTDPVLEKGEYGYFDDNGLYSGPLIENDDKLYMFYSGRSNGEDYLFYMNIGLAQSKDGGKSFTRYTDVPILGRSEHDPWLVTAPCVFQVKGQWHMIYTSGTKIFRNRTSNYDLKLAKSDDFFYWQQTGDMVIPLEEGESNISTPTIYKHHDTYHLWFSVKPQVGEYRIGYATSIDGLHWSRDDSRLGLKTSKSGFDSESLSYPSVFQHGDYLYMVYSGNRNGRDGCGLARLSLQEL